MTPNVPWLCEKCCRWHSDYHYAFTRHACCLETLSHVRLAGRDVLLSVLGVHPLAVRHGLRGQVVGCRGSVLVVRIDGAEYQFTRDEVRLTCLT